MFPSERLDPFGQKGFTRKCGIAGFGALRPLPERFSETHEQIPELRLVPVLRVQVRLIMVNGVDQPPDLILVQIDLHALYDVLHMVFTADFFGTCNAFKRRVLRGMITGELQNCHIDHCTIFAVYSPN